MADVNANVLRTVRVISAAYIRSQDTISKNEVLEFIRSLIKELSGREVKEDILKAKGIKILFADEEVING